MLLLNTSSRTNKTKIGRTFSHVFFVNITYLLLL